MYLIWGFAHLKQIVNVWNLHMNNFEKGQLYFFLLMSSVIPLAILNLQVLIYIEEQWTEHNDYFCICLFCLNINQGDHKCFVFILFEVIIHENLKSYSPQISIIHNESQMWSVKSNSLLTTGLVAWPLVKKVLYYFAQSNNVLCR